MKKYTKMIFGAVIVICLGGIVKMSIQKNWEIPSFMQKDNSPGIDSNVDISETGPVLTEEDVRNPEEEDVYIPAGPGRMSPMELDSFIGVVRSWDEEQIEVVLDNIPIEKIYNRIGRELKQAKELQKSLRKLVTPEK